jgi:5-(carboxyamino)imidazole ribonucleotide synthase
VSAAARTPAPQAPGTDVGGTDALAPGNWLGVLGGGQLGRMFCHAAQSLGYRVCVLDPVEGGPAGAVADRQIVADYDDPAALDQMANLCAAVTTEFENVPARSLERLARVVPVRPRAEAVAIAQDRIREKRFVASCGVDVAPHAAIAAGGPLPTLEPALFPGILKTARLGYDGKGQIAVPASAGLRDAWQRLGSVDCVLEARLALRRELSVIVARGVDGATAAFPVNENEHRGGILARTRMPAPIGAEQAERARAIAVRVADGLQYVGVLCVELFELQDGRILVNEIAPRPHNSGHATIDACVSSQFEQQARTLAGMPLGDPRALAPAVMLNLLGDLWFDAAGRRRDPAFERILAVAGACLHLYGKSDPRPGRKMGHVTIVAETMESACRNADRVAAILGLDLPPAAQPAGGGA